MDNYSPLSMIISAGIFLFAIWLGVTITRRFFAAVRDLRRIAEACERQAKSLEKLTLQNQSAQHEIQRFR